MSFNLTTHCELFEIQRFGEYRGTVKEPYQKDDETFSDLKKRAWEHAKRIFSKGNKPIDQHDKLVYLGRIA